MKSNFIVGILVICKNVVIQALNAGKVPHCQHCQDIQDITIATFICNTSLHVLVIEVFNRQMHWLPAPRTLLTAVKKCLISLPLNYITEISVCIELGLGDNVSLAKLLSCKGCKDFYHCISYRLWGQRNTSHK